MCCFTTLGPSIDGNLKDVHKCFLLECAPAGFNKWTHLEVVRSQTNAVGFATYARRPCQNVVQMDYANASSHATPVTPLEVRRTPKSQCTP